MLNVLDDTVFSLNEGKKQAISVSPIELAHKLVTVHRRAFASTHDPDQQDPYKVLEIISANPTIAAVSSTGDIAAVGLFQKDNRFTFAGIQLVEPTFFTDPTFEGKGLSTALRQETVRQIGSGSFTDPTLIFGESIRGSSFGLCLANDFLLGGDGNTISGDLGDAYAKIGNASGGNIGLMPMGLTYLIDPRLKV